MRLSCLEAMIERWNVMRVGVWFELIFFPDILYMRYFKFQYLKQE